MDRTFEALISDKMNLDLAISAAAEGLTVRVGFLVSLSLYDLYGKFAFNHQFLCGGGISE